MLRLVATEVLLPLITCIAVWEITNKFLWRCHRILRIHNSDSTGRVPGEMVMVGGSGGRRIDLNSAGNKVGGSGGIPSRFKIECHDVRIHSYLLLNSIIPFLIRMRPSAYIHLLLTS